MTSLTSNNHLNLRTTNILVTRGDKRRWSALLFSSRRMYVVLLFLFLLHSGADISKPQSPNASSSRVPDYQILTASKEEPKKTIPVAPSSNVKLFPVSSIGGPLSKVGFIDSSGTLVIDYAFYSADSFSEGLACVTLVRDGKEGYIDATGQVVIEPKFDWAFPFQERRAKVRLNGKWGYIDPAGKIVVEPKFEEADNFYEGLAGVKVAGKWGYIDPAGKLVIPALFDDANGFSEGLACVLKNNRVGYVDRSGDWVIPAQFERMSSPTEALLLPNFKEGLAVAKKDGKYGYIDRSGQFAIPAYFDRANSFSEGLAPITTQNKMGYITKTGEIAFAPQFDVARPFSEGLAEIAIDHKWGFIDLTGKIVIEPRFDLVMRFTDGIAYASVGRTEGYIDKRGKWVWVTPGDDNNSSTGPSDDAPVVTYVVKPAYPPLAAAKNINGTVLVDVQIDMEGIVREASSQSGPTLLRKAAEKAATRWRFRPIETGSGMRSARLSFTFRPISHVSQPSEYDFTRPYHMAVSWEGIAGSVKK